MEQDDEHRLMISVSRGIQDVGQSIFQDQPKGPTVIVTDLSIKYKLCALAPLIETGINVVIPSQRSIPANLLDPKIKHRSRLWMKMADIELQTHKGKNNWALWLDPDGYATEGNNNNFFIVRNGTIMTPEGRNVLRGVCRNYIFELANELEIPCIEKNIDFFDICNADEAFVTGTSFSMIHVTSINQRPIGNRTKGTITQSLMDIWSDKIGVNIESQLQHYGKSCGVI
jgi:branched-chain amino acid aminotransferase